MNALNRLHDLGQSVWLDNIRRELLTSGTLAKWIAELSVTGLTSNPTIFEHAIGQGADYDDAIRRHAGDGRSPEEVFFAVALEDITAAADLFRSVHDHTAGVDGFVSLEVSPALADDAAGTIAEAKRLHAAAARPNVFIKVPGTAAGLEAIEELILAGVPINVTLLFSREHYLACAYAYLKGLERRVAAGLAPDVASVASLFISRWDGATQQLPEGLRDRLGVAIGQRAYKAYRDLLAAPRWQALVRKGARPQRLLMASTGTKSKALPDTYYVTALAAPNTVNTMPEQTLLAFADHGEVRGPLPMDGGDCEAVIAQVGAAGVDVDALAAELQIKGRDAFVASFDSLLARVAAKMQALRAA
ncbi:MAG: transaldolase [Deltaproteobacteria bacterium]|nr:transaldolase [Deltaproteobacteria bacterium]